jgi:hypothetical protein
MKRKTVGSDRRGFLAMLGLGTVAGPSALKEAANGQGFNSLGRLASNIDFRDNDDGDGGDQDELPRRSKIQKDGEYYKNNIKKTVDDFNKVKQKDYSKELPEYIRRVGRLDSDLLVNRSLSLNARLRLQALRNIELDRRNQLRYKETFINSAVRRARSTLSDNECFDLIATNIIRDKTKPLPTLEMFLKVIGPKEE